MALILELIRIMYGRLFAAQLHVHSQRPTSQSPVGRRGGRASHVPAILQGQPVLHTATGRLAGLDRGQHQPRLHDTLRLIPLHISPLFTILWLFCKGNGVIYPKVVQCGE